VNLRAERRYGRNGRDGQGSSEWLPDTDEGPVRDIVSLREDLGLPAGRVLGNGEVSRVSAHLEEGVTSYDEYGLVTGWTVSAAQAAQQEARLSGAGIVPEEWTRDLPRPASGNALMQVRARQLAERGGGPDPWVGTENPCNSVNAGISVISG
jgi:hypothetical protein